MPLRSGGHTNNFPTLNSPSMAPTHDHMSHFAQQSTAKQRPALPPLHIEQAQAEQELVDFADDFNLLDVIGGSSLAVMHPAKPVVAYASGCIIIVFIMTSDTKRSLVGHSHEVHDLAFTPEGDILVSVDFNRNDSSEASDPVSVIITWDWSLGI